MVFGEQDEEREYFVHFSYRWPATDGFECRIGLGQPIAQPEVL